MNKRLMFAIAAIIVAGITLTGCSAPTPTTSDIWGTLQKTKTDPNHIKGLTTSTISLLETPTLTTAPLFKTDIKLPAGWKVDPHLADAFDGQNKKVPTYYEAFAAYNSDQSCSVIGAVSFLDISNSGKGDLYLSKNYLYQSLQSYNSGAKNESSVLITDNTKKLQFVVGSYDAQAPVFQNDASGASTQNGTSEAKGYIIVRALDTALKNPYINSTGTSGQKTGLPIITYTYTCAKPSQVTIKDFNNLANALAVQVK